MWYSSSHAGITDRHRGGALCNPERGTRPKPPQASNREGQPAARGRHRGRPGEAPGRHGSSAQRDRAVPVRASDGRGPTRSVRDPRTLGWDPGPASSPLEDAASPKGPRMTAIAREFAEAFDAERPQVPTPPDKRLAAKRLR